MEIQSTKPDESSVKEVSRNFSEENDLIDEGQPSATISTENSESPLENQTASLLLEERNDDMKGDKNTYILDTGGTMQTWEYDTDMVVINYTVDENGEQDIAVEENKVTGEDSQSILKENKDVVDYKSKTTTNHNRKQKSESGLVKDEVMDYLKDKGKSEELSKDLEVQQNNENTHISPGEETNVEMEEESNVVVKSESSRMISFSTDSNTGHPIVEGNFDREVADNNTQRAFPSLQKNPDVQTLEDALKYFDLYSGLQQLEKSLEDVRRCRKTKEEHECDLKQLDNEMKKLSFHFHPDRVTNKGRSDEEIAHAQKLQTALNATRMVLNILSQVFLEDLDIDHKYGFYTNLNISSLGNEDEIKSHVFEVLLKISLISEIKQNKIIAEIRKFLIESKCCVNSYLADSRYEFELFRDSALFHFKKCIEGYKKLLKEFQEVEEECEAEKMNNVHSLIHKMAKKSSKELELLQQLMEVAEHSLEGTFQRFRSTERLDKYFVLPFVSYISLILMCNVVINYTREDKSFENTTRSNIKCSWIKRLWSGSSEDNSIHKSLIRCLYHMLSYSIDEHYKDMVREMTRKGYLNPQEVSIKFRIILREIKKDLEDKFKVDHYNDLSFNRNARNELKECFRMMSDFQKKEEKLSKEIKKFKRETQEMKAECSNFMKDSSVISEQLEEHKKQNEILRKRLSLLSENALFS